MFYRLLKISAWARRHQKLAILVIVLLQGIFILLSLYLGHLLREYGYVLGRPFLFIGFLLIIDGLFLFPSREELKEVFVNPRKLWVKMIASMFIFLGSMILLMGYEGKKEFKTDNGQGLITRAYAIETAPQITMTQSQLQHDYATKFIVKLNPGEKAKTLGFWRVVGLFFINLLLIAIFGYSSLLFCASLCAGNLWVFALILVDTTLFYWGVVYWLFNGALTKRNRYNFGIVMGILLYAAALSMYSVLPLELYEEGLKTIWPVLVNLVISVFIVFWGHNLPVFRFKPKTKKEVEVETE